MAKSNEPLWWSLFSAGGVVSAFLIPVTVLITAVAVPAGWISGEGLRELVQHPLARLYLFAVISLSMFHWAHRFRHTVAELTDNALGSILAVFCYGGAGVVTVLTIVFLVRL